MFFAAELKNFFSCSVLKTLKNDFNIQYFKKFYQFRKFDVMMFIRAEGRVNFLKVIFESNVIGYET